jgi:YD repeat-containing protein
MKMKFCQFVFAIFGILLSLCAEAQLTGTCAATRQCGPKTQCDIPPKQEPPDPCNTRTGSPCYVRSGVYATSATDLQVNAVGAPLYFSRTYQSSKTNDGLLGRGWSASTSARVTYSVFLFSAPSTYKKVADVSMPDGSLERFSENTDGTFTPQANIHDILTHNGDGSWDLEKFPGRAIFHFSSTGELLSITDEFGNAQNWAYLNSRVDRITDVGSGRYLTFGYNANGRIYFVQDSAGRRVQYAYDAQGMLMTFTDAANRNTTYSYTPGRLMPVLTQVQDNWGRVVTTNTYNTGDILKSYTEGGETFTYTYYYNGDQNQTKKSPSITGSSWIFTTAANGLITNRSQAGVSESFVYNPDESLQLATDGLGDKTYYTYNANGTVASVTRNYQGPLAIRFDSAYDPNFPDKVTSITPKDPSTGTVNLDWQAWRFDYYQAGSAAPGALFHIYRVRNNGSTLDTMATFTYNSQGQRITVSKGGGPVTSYAYDAVTKDLLSVTFPKNSDSGANSVYTYGYDNLGRAISITDPTGHSTTYAYDNLDRITQVTLPKPSPSTLNFATTMTYDNYDSASGFVFLNQIDPNGKVTRQGYDQYGRLRQSIDILGKITAFAYKGALLSSVTDANGNVASYTYDSQRRLFSTTSPSGAGNSYIYRDDNLLSADSGTAAFYDYDSLKRLISKDGNGTSSSYTTDYTYVGQKLTQVTKTTNALPQSPVIDTESYDYDASYRISGETEGTNGHIDYTYDSADRISGYSIPGRAWATYSRYDDGSLNTIAWSRAPGFFKYTYTPNGQYGTITFPNGQHRDYTYDDQGRLTQLANIHPTTGSLGTYAYGYDVDYGTGQGVLGLRTSMTADGNLTKYYYDPLYQLNRVDYPNVSPFNNEVDSWTYDDIGNRLTSTVNGTTTNYTYYKNSSNPLNNQRLQSDGVNTFTYNGFGQTVSAGTYPYYWYDTSGQAQKIYIAPYYYDYLGRRQFGIYDGQNLIAEGYSNADYVFGPGIDEPLAMYRSGSVSYYTVDGLGSVTKLSSESGVVQNTYVYDAWGVLRNKTGTLSYSAQLN